MGPNFAQNFPRVLKNASLANHKGKANTGSEKLSQIIFKKKKFEIS